MKDRVAESARDAPIVPSACPSGTLVLQSSPALVSADREQSMVSQTYIAGPPDDRLGESAMDMLVTERLAAAEPMVHVPLYNVMVAKAVEIRLLAALAEKVGVEPTVCETYRSFDGQSIYMSTAWCHRHRRRIIAPGRDAWVEVTFFFRAQDGPALSLPAWAVRMKEAEPERLAMGKSYVAVSDVRLLGEFERLSPTIRL